MSDLVTVTRTLPVAFRVKLPSDWAVEPGAETADVASFQASLASKEDDTPAGKLAVVVFARSAVGRPREVAAPYLEALADGGLRVIEDDFAEETPPEPFERSWLLESPVTRSQSLPGELRCRVLRHAQAWVLAGVLGPRREDDPEAWEQDRRALDVLTTSMKIKG
jgi:hypothetical protein